MATPVNVILQGDCLEVLKTLPDACVDSVVTDPPYGLGQHDPTTTEILSYLQGDVLKTGDFMGKDWDIPSVAVWKEVFRVLKPGGHLLVFAGTRTWDVMSIGIRVAGFENRDTIAAQFGPNSNLSWNQGQGFPKSHDVSKKIDHKLGATRKVIGTKKGVGGENLNDIVNGVEVRQTTDEGGKGVGAYGTGAKQVAIDVPITEASTEEAKRWSGWGTALKPAHEPILMFRKPLEESTVAEQLLKTGTGAINIDGCRVGYNKPIDQVYKEAGSPGKSSGKPLVYGDYKGVVDSSVTFDPKGRWPANFILTHAEGCKVIGTKKVKAPVINRFDDGMKPFGEGAGHEFTSTPTGDANGQEDVSVYECVEGCPAKVLDEQSGDSTDGFYSGKRNQPKTKSTFGDFELRDEPPIGYGGSGGASRFFAQFEPNAPFIYQSKAARNEKDTAEELGERAHPTMKPLKLMEYLVRLVTPKGGIVLDPYAGSGTTCLAAANEGIKYIGIELDPTYHKIASRRLEVQGAKAEAYHAERAAFDAVFDLPQED